MILVNFGHPLTEKQRSKILEITAKGIDQEIYRPAKLDHHAGFQSQVIQLVDEVGLNAEQWQNEIILINPPSLNAIAVTLLAELHGRMGYFPSMLRLSPVENANPPEFEVAEILNLQGIRDQARKRR